MSRKAQVKHFHETFTDLIKLQNQLLTGHLPGAQNSADLDKEERLKNFEVSFEKINEKTKQLLDEINQFEVNC